MTHDEWKIEPETGKRYRRIGNSIEYEMMIQTDAGLIPESQLAEHNSRMREQREAEQKRIAAELKAEQERPKKTCPLRDGLNTTCGGNTCAFYFDDHCALAQISDRPPAKKTKGLKCPLNYCYVCHESCVLFSNGGCKIIDFVKGLKQPGKE